jgi:thiol-disulfide isomerase/thioredoxin
MIFSSYVAENFVLSVFAVILMAWMPQQEWHELSTSNAPEDTLLKDITANELQDVLDSYNGEKAVLINIWATWCAPCIEEFPHIVELQREYQDELKVIFVSADFPESRDKAVEFLKDQNVDWTTYFKTGKDQPFIEALSDSWSGALPFTKILNEDGKVVTSWEQGADYEKFKDNIKKAINN